MFQKKTPEYIILNRCKSFSNNRKKINKNNLIDKHQTELISITNIQSPKNKPKLVGSKSQTNFYKKTIKFSMNRYHKYIKNMDNINNNLNKRPISLYINKKINNNRDEIGNNYSSLSRNKLFFNNLNSNSSFKERTIFSSNNNKKKLNLLNIGGINSPINRRPKIFNGLNDNNSFFGGIDNGINKKIGNLTLNEKLKNSKFFNKTKYINGLKNKNIKKNKSPLLSTYNILLKPNDDDLLYNAINEIIMKHIMNNINNVSKRTENNDQKNFLQNNQFNEQSQIEKAKIFDLIPVVLNHMKHKKNMDDLYNEYNKYLANISESSNNNIEYNNKIKNPLIRYLFLENILNNLKHIVKFINIKSKEEIEQKVIKIIGNEYSKLEEDKKDNNNNKDFSTIGFEYNPKHKEEPYKYKYLMDKGFQTSKFSNRKSIFFINEKKFEDCNDFTNNEIVSPTRKIFLKNSISSRRKIDFDIKVFEEKKKINQNIKNELNDIFSNSSTTKNNEKTKNRKDESENQFFKIKEIKNLINISKKSSIKRSVIVAQNKKKFLKINLNKLNLNINDIIKPKEIKKLDSTDRMVNPPSLEKLNQKNENKKIKKEENKIINNIENKKSKIIKNNTLTNILLAKKTNGEKKVIKKIEKKIEEKKESSDDDIEEKEGNEDDDIQKLSKENIEKLKKIGKFRRRYKKALKDKKKQEKIYKETLENNKIALREIKKAERQKKKKKKSVFKKLKKQKKKKKKKEHLFLKN